MKRKSVIALLAVMATSLVFSGCGSTPTSSTNGNSQDKENEITAPQDEEQGTVQQLSWTILAELDTYQDTLRVPFETAFNTKTDETIGEKIGKLYLDNNGNYNQNQTLLGVIRNVNSRQVFEKNETISAIANAALNTYADLEGTDEMTQFYMGINGYFNLLPDTEEGYCNPSSTLTRSEFMAMLMRAETPVDESLQVSEDFKAAVGESEYNLYAQFLADDAYLSLLDKSLNNQTYNGTISRAEAVYMLMNHYFAEDLEAMDLSTMDTVFDDAKDGGDIATAQDYANKDYGKSYEMVYAINNPNGGLPTDLYKALVLAERYGLVDSETRWDEGLTKSEAISFVYDTIMGGAAIKVNNEQATSAETENSSQNNKGSYYYEEDGDFDYGYAESGLTREEDRQDGWLGFTVHYNEDGTTYLTYNKDGTRYDVGDTLPDGTYYAGITEADIEKLDKEAADFLEDLGFFD